MIERLALYAMGTRFEMALSGASSTALRAAGEAALDTVRELHQLWSAFDPGSLLTRVNRLAAGRPVSVDGETFAILLLARELWEATDGRFDPTIGEKMRVGGFRGDRHRSAEVVGTPGMEAVELQEESSTVWFRDPQIELDLGAIAKGVALDRAAVSLRESEVPCALLHGGTSSVIAIGAPPDSEGWPIALDDEGDLPRVHLRDAALAVSAGWGRVVEADGEVRVKGEPISTVLVSDNVRPRLVSFLQEVIRGDLDDPHPYRQSPLTLGYRAGPVEGAAAISKHIAELVSEHMGDDDNIWAGPYIPERKLRGARKIHERHLPEDEEVLALYDDTVFGSAEEGFILTVRRLCWKNFTEHPRQVPWEYLPPEQILVVDDSSVGVGDCHIDVLAYTERPRRAAKLLREIRALFS